VSSKYLLPCVCGEQIPIEPREAGETVACRCGASLQAPTLREICALEPAPEDLSPPPAVAPWGWRQGLRLLGTVVLLSALGWAVWLFLNPPASRFDVFDPEMIRREANKMPPTVTWDNWEKAKEGLDRRVDQKYARDMEAHHGLFVLPGLLAVIGVGLILSTLSFASRPQSGTQL
jgi:hypothetical protein